MKNKVKKDKHLCLEERIEIYRLRELGLSGRAIAEKIGRHHSVVNRELGRNSKPYSEEYKPIKAHHISQTRSNLQRQQAPLKNPKVFLYVRKKLRSSKWTPEQIAGRLSVDLPGENISYETIYQYIYGLGKKDKLWTHLVRHHKKRKKRKFYKLGEKRTRLKNTVSIEKRPTKANNRSQVGHWETDLMESKRGINANVSAHIERKTRYVKLEKLANKKAKTKQKNMEKTLKILQSLSKAKKPIVKSITYDNGSENAYHYKTSKKA